MEINTILKDPDYQGLPPVEKRKVLHHFLSEDEDYNGLPGTEKRKVINNFMSMPAEKETQPELKSSLQNKELLNINKILNDKGYQKLPPAEQRKVLHHFLGDDEGYSKLPGTEQRKVINNFIKEPIVEQKAAGDNTTMESKDDGSLIDFITENWSIENVKKRLRDSLPDWVPGAEDREKQRLSEQGMHELTADEKRKLPIDTGPGLDLTKYGKAPSKTVQKELARTSPYKGRDKNETIEQYLEKRKAQRGVLGAVKGGYEQSALGTLIRNEVSEYEPHGFGEGVISGVSSVVSDAPVFAVLGLISENPAAIFGGHAAIKTFADARARGELPENVSNDELLKVTDLIRDMAVSGAEGALSGAVLSKVSKIVESVAPGVYNAALKKGLKQGMSRHKAIEYATKQGLRAGKITKVAGIPAETMALHSPELIKGEGINPNNLAKSMTELAVLKSLPAGASKIKKQVYGNPYFKDMTQKIEVKSPKPVIEEPKTIKPLKNKELEISFGDFAKTHHDRAKTIDDFINTDSKHYEKEFKNVPVMESQILDRWVKNPAREIQKVYGDKVHDVIVRPLRSAEHNFILEDKAVQAGIKDIGKKYNSAERERVGAWLTAQQKDGLSILEEMGVKVPELTQKEQTLAVSLRNELDKLHERVNASRGVAGLGPIGDVQNYFTFLRKFSIAEELGFNPLTMPKEAWENIEVKGSSFRFGKERTGSNRPIELDALHVYSKYNQAALRTIHMTPVIGKLRKIIDKGLSEKDIVGHNYLSKYIDYISGMKVEDNFPRVVNKVANFANRNIGAFILSYNLHSAMIQPTALVNSYIKTGPKYLAEGIAGLMNKKMRDFALQKSEVLLGRKHDIALEEMKKGFYGNVGKARNKIIDVGTAPLKTLDYYTAMASWISFFKHGTKHLKLNEKDAVKFADDWVIKSQGSASRIDLAPVQRTPVGKALSLFQTFAINNWNFIMDDVVKNKQLSYAQRSHQLARLVVAGALSNTFYRMTGEALPFTTVSSPMPSPLYSFHKAYQETGEATEGFKEAGRELLTIVPFLSGARYGGKSAFGATPQLGFEIFETLSGKGNKSPAYILSKIAGIPGGQQVYKWMKRWENEQKKNKILSPAAMKRKYRREVVPNYKAEILKELRAH